MMMKLVPSAFAAALALSTPAHSLGPPPAPVAATLADVAFMAGHWIGGEAGDLSEEIWSAPAGDSMLGMWRYVSKGQARIYELLTLTAEGPHVVLRIRHFDPKLVAREDKERSVELRLVGKGASEAVFAGPDYDGKGSVRLTYRGGPDTLTGVLEKSGSKQEFRFRRR
jgi:Domain of unknown function (DUF6265)